MIVRNLIITILLVGVFSLLGASLAHVYFDQPPTQPINTIAHYEDVKERIQNDIKVQEKIIDSEYQQPHKLEHASNEIKRLSKAAELADLRIKMIEDPANSDKYDKRVMEIFDELEALYGPGQPAIPLP